MFTFISCFMFPSKSFNRLAKRAEPFLCDAVRLTQCANQALLPNTFGRQYIQRLIAEYHKQQSQLADRVFKYYQTSKSFGWLKSLLPGTKAFSARRKLAKNMNAIERALSELNTINTVLKDLPKIGEVYSDENISDENTKKQKCFMGGVKSRSTIPPTKWDKKDSSNKETYQSLFQLFGLTRSSAQMRPSSNSCQPRSEL